MYSPSTLAEWDGDLLEADAALQVDGSRVITGLGRMG